MNLSECLGYPEKPMHTLGGGCSCEMCFQNLIWNTALTACDREIDREALAKLLFGIDYPGGEWELCMYQEDCLDQADYIISTMPTWLRKVKE